MTSVRAEIAALLVGGPTLWFRYRGLSILTDPTFDPPGMYPGEATLRKLSGPAVHPDILGPVDIVLLSHDQHADNLDRSGRAYLSTAGTVLSTTDAAARINYVHGLENWESVVIETPDDGWVVVTGVPARPGPARSESVTGLVTGFVVQSSGWPTVYISGDNTSLTAVERVAEHFVQIDVAVLYTGAANTGRFGDLDSTFNARTALLAAELLADAVIVPIHAEGWSHYSETLDRLTREFEYGREARRLRIPQPGRLFNV